MTVYGKRSITVRVVSFDASYNSWTSNDICVPINAKVSHFVAITLDSSHRLFHLSNKVCCASNVAVELCQRFPDMAFRNAVEKRVNATSRRDRRMKFDLGQTRDGPLKRLVERKDLR